MPFAIERIDPKAALARIQKIAQEGVPTEETIQTGGVEVEIGKRKLRIGPKRRIVVDPDRY